MICEKAHFSIFARTTPAFVGALEIMSVATYQVLVAGLGYQADSDIVMVDLVFWDDSFEQDRSWDDFGTTISSI